MPSGPRHRLTLPLCVIAAIVLVLVPAWALGEEDASVAHVVRLSDAGSDARALLVDAGDASTSARARRRDLDASATRVQRREPDPSAARVRRRDRDAGEASDAALDAGADVDASDASDADVDADSGNEEAGLADADVPDADAASEQPDAASELALEIPSKGPTELLPVPSLDTPKAEQPTQEVPLPPKQRPYAIIKVLLGLVLLLALAYGAGHPRVLRWEQRLGISQAITAGFPFVGIGLIASLPSVGILSENVLADLGPVLRLGLGWIGFVVGFRFDVKRVEQLSQELASVAVRRVIVAFVTIVAVAALVLLGEQVFFSEALTERTFLRDALILGAAGIVTARSAPAVSAQLGASEESQAVVAAFVRIEEFVAVLGLLVVGAYFRPTESTTWYMPGSGWLLLTLGIGAVIGVIVYGTMLLKTTGVAEYYVLALGSIAFAAGMAGRIHISPVVVCFIAGVLLANVPGPNKQRFEQTLLKLERPIYFVFLMVVGALWKVAEIEGWVLMVAFTFARFAGKWLGAALPSQTSKLGPKERRALVLTPMSALSVAIVVSAGTLYPGGSIPEIVTAVLGAAIVSEILVQRALRIESANANGGARRKDSDNGQSSEEPKS